MDVYSTTADGIITLSTLHHRSKVEDGRPSEHEIAAPLPIPIMTSTNSFHCR